MDYTLRTISPNNWITLLLVSVLIILAVTRVAYPRRFYEFIQLPITNKYFKLQGKQGKGFEIQHPFNIAFLTVQSICFSLFLYLCLQVLKPALVSSNPWLFLQLITGFTVFVLVKYVSEKIIAHIFNIDKLINNYLFEKLSYTSLISLLIFVGNILFFYYLNPSKTGIIIMGVVIAVLFAISLVSSFKRNGNIIFSHFFYFILYLCALEIAPYIIVYKLIV